MLFHQRQQKLNKTFKGKPDKRRLVGVVSLLAGGGKGPEDPRRRASRPEDQGGNGPGHARGGDRASPGLFGEPSVSLQRYTKYFINECAVACGRVGIYN